MKALLQLEQSSSIDFFFFCEAFQCEFDMGCPLKHCQLYIYKTGNMVDVN